MLLADDNADMREYVERLLCEHGYDVTCATDGRHVFDMAIADPPDLGLTDVMMPELDGLGLLTALRSRGETRTIPIILLSGRAGEEAQVEGLECGADDYLIKPFTARELLARVDAHRSLSRMRKEIAESLHVVTEAANKKLAGLTRQMMDVHEHERTWVAPGPSDGVIGCWRWRHPSRFRRRPMQLPFTREQFFDLLAAYNATLWPGVLALWIASVLVAVLLPLRREAGARQISRRRCGDFRSVGGFICRTCGGCAPIEAISRLISRGTHFAFPRNAMRIDTPVTRLALAMKTPGHPARLRILAMLRHNELSVCQIASVLNVAPSTASGYFTELRRADLVTEQRESKWVHYRLSDEDPTAAPIRFVLVLVAADPQVGQDAGIARRLSGTSPDIVCAGGSVDVQAPVSSAPGA